jgi:hypothetical protein
VNGDKSLDIIASAGPQVNIYSLAGGSPSLLRSFFAASPDFRGGVYVASGDIDGDGTSDIITGLGTGGQPQVTIFSGATGAVLSRFSAFQAEFTGGVTVATSDLTGDNVPDIITGMASGGGLVRVYNGATFAPLYTLAPFGSSFTGGVSLAHIAIPEPSTALMLLTGAALALGRGRRGACR